MHMLFKILSQTHFLSGMGMGLVWRIAGTHTDDETDATVDIPLVLARVEDGWKNVGFGFVEEDDSNHQKLLILKIEKKSKLIQLHCVPVSVVFFSFSFQNVLGKHFICWHWWIWSIYFVCLCRRSCSPMPSWCLWWSASWDLSTFILSSRKQKIKPLWISVRALPRSTKPLSPPLARKWSWFYPLSLKWMEKSKTSQRWRAPSSWTTYTVEIRVKIGTKGICCLYIFIYWLWSMKRASRFLGSFGVLCYFVHLLYDLDTWEYFGVFLHSNYSLCVLLKFNKNVLFTNQYTVYYEPQKPKKCLSSSKAICVYMSLNKILILELFLYKVFTDLLALQLYTGHNTQYRHHLIE